MINDDDATANPQYPRLADSFAKKVIIPDFLEEDYGAKQVTFSGLCELAYLGPHVFAPDPGIRKELGVAPDERYFLIRTTALQASHDFGAKGLGEAFVREIVARLSKLGRVFISTEGPPKPALRDLALPIPPDRIHHALAFADLLICDSQTMAAEAAVLGTPSLRMNSFVNKITYLKLLEIKFDLTYGFTPDAQNELLARLDELRARDNLKEEWLKRRDRMLDDC